MGLYGEALEHVKDADVRHVFERFQADHRRHASELPFAIQHIGWATRATGVNVLGHVEELAVKVRCATGTTGALHAMSRAEKLHNQWYAQALTWEVDDSDLATLIRVFSEDERNHLWFMEEHLAPTRNRASV